MLTGFPFAQSNAAHNAFKFNVFRNPDKVFHIGNGAPFRGAAIPGVRHSGGRHSGGPPFRKFPIPGVSHSVTVQWSKGSAVWRVTCPKDFTPSMCWHYHCTVGDINLVNFGPKTVHQKPKIGEFGTPKVCRMWERGRKEHGRVGNENEINVGARKHEEWEGEWRGGETGQGNETEEGKVMAKGRTECEAVVVSWNRNNGNAGDWEPNGNWCLSPSTGGAKAVLRVGTVREKVASHCSGPGISPPENVEILYAKSCNLVHPLLGDPDKFMLSGIFCKDSQKISYSIRYFSWIFTENKRSFSIISAKIHTKLLYSLFSVNIHRK